MLTNGKGSDSEKLLREVELNSQIIVFFFPAPKLVVRVLIRFVDASKLIAGRILSF